MGGGEKGCAAHPRVRPPARKANRHDAGRRMRVQGEGTSLPRRWPGAGAAARWGTGGCAQASARRVPHHPRCAGATTPASVGRQARQAGTRRPPPTRPSSCVPHRGRPRPPAVPHRWPRRDTRRRGCNREREGERAGCCLPVRGHPAAEHQTCPSPPPPPPFPVRLARDRLTLKEKAGRRGVRTHWPSPPHWRQGHTQTPHPHGRRQRRVA